MSTTSYTPGRTNFGPLPDPERSPASFFTSALVNSAILGLAIYIGATAKHIIEQHKYEMTELIVPTTPPPPPKVKVTPPPKLPPPPEPPKVKLEAPKIEMPKPKPEPKPIQMEAKIALPVLKPAAKPAIILAPQPKAALTAAMPAQDNKVKPSTAPVHLGQTFGVTPNPNATRPATIAAIGNPYGGMKGPAVAPHGVVGSTGIGNGLKSGSNAGMVGRVASAGIPGATGTANTGGSYGKVASAGIPAVTQAAGPAARGLHSHHHRPRSPFKTACAVHQRSPAAEGPGRCGAARYLPGKRPGRGAGRGARPWSRTRRRSSPRGAADPLPPRHARRKTGRSHHHHYHHVSIGVTSDLSMLKCITMFECSRNQSRHVKPDASG